MNGFRLNQHARETLHFSLNNGEDISVTIDTLKANSWCITTMDNIQRVYARLENDQVQYEVNGQWRSARVVKHDNRLWVYDADGESQLQFKVNDYNQQDEQQGSLKAPMNGTIIQVDAATGQTVKAGDTLMIMEAMKMEHAIKAPEDGTIKEISFGIGDLVAEGAMLIKMEDT
jgi:3-methylcrotonyl-CoA carboxylase alpha subunit